jgi:natural product biosynthesis luciferase-like monooxygenase protein
MGVPMQSTAGVSFVSNQTGVPKTLVDLLLMRASTQTDRIGYTFLTDGDIEGVALTYGELARKTLSVAGRLQFMGTDQERVLLIFPPGLDYIAAFLACLCARAVAVPVYPPRLNRSLLRLEGIATDAKPAVALTTKDILSRAEPLIFRSQILNSLQWQATDDTEEPEHEWNEPWVNEDTLAVLQYTSGSTGTPKGVMLTHRNLLHNSKLLEHAFEYGPDSHVVSWLPVYHDMGLVGGVLQPLYGGYPCTFMSPLAFLERPVRWLQAITRCRATISGGPNFAYDLCVRKITAEQKSYLDLSSWSVAFNGAEPVRAETIARFNSAFERCGFQRSSSYPCYGLAEGTLIVSGGLKGAAPLIKTVKAKPLESHQVVDADGSDESVKSLVSCGRILLDQKVAIANPDSLGICKTDQVGEIWVSGASVALGYWNRSEETRETFQARLSDTNEGPFLRTGDLGFVSCGELFLSGRLKDLIIIRGLNHYPQDIELSAERSHPGLRPGCGAVFTIQSLGDERLVVVQETEPHQKLDYPRVIEKIRRAVAEDHEIEPGVIVLTKPGAIPKTSSGKLQRHACKAAFLSGTLPVLSEWHSPASSEPKDSSFAPGLDSPQAIEARLVSMLGQRLGVAASGIDINAPISGLGIDSLTAIELVHGIEIEMGICLPMVSLLQGPSIRQLASELLARRNDPTNSSVAPVANAGPVFEHPLSRGQRALWFLQQLSPESTAYHLAAGAMIRGSLDVLELRRAFETLANRHSVLRTTFSGSQEGPRQRVHAEGKFSFQELDGSNWSPAEVDAWLTGETCQPFNLVEGPLLRVSLLYRSQEEHILLIAVHHIISDFWSLSVLVRELGALYTERRTGEPAALLPLRIQFTDYVRWQEEMLAGPEGERLWSFWREHLTGDLPVLNLATDRPRPAVQTYRGASHGFRLSAELIEGLRTLSKSHSTTLYTVLLSAFYVLLHRHTCQDDILVGSLVADRKWADTAGVMGYFVNPIVLRANLSGNPTFTSFLERTQRMVLASLNHQDYPFPLLIERLQPERDPSRSPLFQVMFVLQKTHGLDEQGLASFALGEGGGRLQMGELVLESMPVSHRAAQFDMMLVMAEASGLEASLQYNTDLFDGNTIQLLSERFITLVQSIGAEPFKRLPELRLLPECEQRQLLIEWNQTTANYPKNSCIHQLFEAAVVERPEALAVVFEDIQLSYGELNRGANELAVKLKSLGVGPEVPVAICVERSLEMIKGVLGILKAGGAYVPLDPNLPGERLAFMVEDSGARILLTQVHLGARLSGRCGEVLCVDLACDTLKRENEPNLRCEATPENLCYVMYTSGSTGKPKGVMVCHRNVVNFFTAMDARIGCTAEDVLLAVTSVSFDISVLELLWPLINGGRIVLLSQRAVTGGPSGAIYPAKSNGKVSKIEFSLFYFAADNSQPTDDRYRLLLEGAKFADQNGFAAVWTPERHFHAFGGLYPNPSVTTAALAVLTERLRLRAGSVVMPLHDPIRVAEEWSLADNLSKGRVGIAFASGWHSDDFVFFPENYAERKQIMMRGIDMVQKLWRGEHLVVKGGAGNDVEVRIYPKPIQRELPIWLTAAGAPDTFIKAGEIGANVLTHLLGQTIEDVAGKIRLYRDSLARNGRDPESGKVTLMLHTFVGDSTDAVRKKVRRPFTSYLRSSIGLISNLIRSLNLPLDVATMSETDINGLLDFAFDRYFETSALFGSMEQCERTIGRLREIGVSEVASLIDFGVDSDSVLASLQQLKALKEASNFRKPGNDPPTGEDYSLRAEAKRHGASMMQCTPSMMSMLAMNTDAVDSLESLRILILGGEVLPQKLAKQMKRALPARLMNMYGPTETTIWSASHEVAENDRAISIGGPIANNQIYILDHRIINLPPGSVGEVYIGGEGVARGYRGRPDLCAHKFIPDPFGAPGTRLYSTGDLARHQPDGSIDLLGRTDYQIKIRGFRVELGEIESILSEHEAVHEAVVLAREDTQADKRLTAYVVLKDGAAIKSLRPYLRERLADYMVPSAFVAMEAMPQTPNGKIDRKGLPPADGILSTSTSECALPRSKLERTIARVWQDVLKLKTVSVQDNFFDIGGHSLLMAQVHSHLRKLLGRDLQLVKLLEHPTISSLARYLAEADTGHFSVKQNSERVQKQRERLRRQRDSLAARHEAQ